MSDNQNYANVSIASDSLGATLTGASYGVSKFVTGTIQAAWTGTPTGNFTIQVSNDADNATPTNWTTLPSSTQAAGGGVGSYVWYLDTIGYAHVRFVYTRSSSTGTVTARFVGK